MVSIHLKIQDKNGNILSEIEDVDAVSCIYASEYREGDVIILEVSPSNCHIVWQVDDALGASMCYITGPITYHIPFAEQKKVYSPK